MQLIIQFIEIFETYKFEKHQVLCDLEVKSFKPSENSAINPFNQQQVTKIFPNYWVKQQDIDQTE